MHYTFELSLLQELEVFKYSSLLIWSIVGKAKYLTDEENTILIR